MTERFVTRDSDGGTIDLKQEEAEHADITANAKRVILIDSSGNAIGVSTSAKQLVDGHNVTSTINQTTPGTTNNVTIQASYDGTNYVVPRVDASTHAFNTITYAHHEIHAGSSYSSHFGRTTANADDARSVMAFTTPNSTKWLHIVASASASSPAEFFILEDPTTLDLDEGTPKTVFNRNRNSVNVSGVLPIVTTPVAGTVTTFTETQINGAQLTGGAVIEHMLLAGGEGPKAIGGLSRGSQEWILKPNKKYLFILQNIGTNVNLHQISLDWYEHTDKN